MIRKGTRSNGRARAGLEALFGSRTRAKLLTIFLSRPREEYYVRELARRAEISLRAIQHELATLERISLVESRRRGREKFYQANVDHPLYPDLRRLVSKVAHGRRGLPKAGDLHTQIDGEMLRRDPVLSEIVRRLVDAYAPERIYLFGSKAREEGTPDSDYDLLLVIPDDAPPERRRSRLAYERLWGTGAAADVLVWTRSDFNSRLHLKASLPSTIIREGRLLHAA